MDEFAAKFGMQMGQLVTEYRATYAWFALLPHLGTAVLLFLVFRYGQRCRKAFAVYFFLNYVWLVIFVGGWFSLHLYQRMGVRAFAMYGGTPVLLLAILYQWVQELRRPRLDLDFRKVDRRRLFVSVPFLVWGFWYPPYEWGVRLIFDPRELLFGAYGLMGCPTTLVLLALLFLKYPEGNRPLFYTLTGYAVIIGAAMFGLKYVPDIPFFFFGLASLSLVLWTGLRKRKDSTARERRPA
jgi:hypothetical protein